MGKPQPQTPDVAGTNVLRTIGAQGPAALNAFSADQTNIAQNQLAADQAVSPGYAQLNYNILSQYGPQMAALGNQLSSQMALGGNQAIANAAGSPAGQQMVSLADQYQKQLDPNAYAVRNAAGQGLTSLIGAMDPTKLSGSELANVQRGIAQQPGALTPSATNTVQNAMTFGNALQQKQANYANIVGQATSAIPNLASGLNGFGLATAGVNRSNPGLSAYQGPTQNAGGGLLQAGMQTMAGAASGAFQQGQQKQQGLLGQLGGLFGGGSNSTFSGIGSALNSIF
jgi:hypothetical protein